MEDGISDSTLNKLHTLICDIIECDTNSVRGEYIKEYLLQNKKRIREILDKL